MSLRPWAERKFKKWVLRVYIYISTLSLQELLSELDIDGLSTNIVLRIPQKFS